MIFRRSRDAKRGKNVRRAVCKSRVTDVRHLILQIHVYALLPSELNVYIFAKIGAPLYSLSYNPTSYNSTNRMIRHISTGPFRFPISHIYFKPFNSTNRLTRHMLFGPLECLSVICTPYNSTSCKKSKRLGCQSHCYGVCHHISIYLS